LWHSFVGRGSVVMPEMFELLLRSIQRGCQLARSTTNSRHCMESIPIEESTIFSSAPRVLRRCRMNSARRPRPNVCFCFCIYMMGRRTMTAPWRTFTTRTHVFGSALGIRNRRNKWRDNPRSALTIDLYSPHSLSPDWSSPFSLLLSQA
jgi:hypothetical protein